MLPMLPAEPTSKWKESAEFAAIITNRVWFDRSKEPGVSCKGCYDGQLKAQEQGLELEEWIG